LQDLFLRLTGPSRAIVAAEDVTFEVELLIKYGVEFEHTAVLACDYRRHFVYDDAPELRGGCCTARLSLEQFGRAIQATIMGVRIVEGGSAFKDGGRVSCSLSSTPREVVLLDCHGGEKFVGSDGYFCLSRNVVSVKLQGTLRVVIQAYSESASGQAQEGHVEFPVKHSQTSEGECFVGNSKVQVVVVWSLLVTDKENLALEGYIGT
jgi:hypothetical protein